MLKERTQFPGATERVTSTTAADLIVSYLEALSVSHVFGVPGGAIEPLYNALARSARAGGPRPIVARHETGAAFMADGYARESGKLGVCLATSGPGMTNAITGVACAFENKVPMLLITGQPALRLLGKGALQESSCTGIDSVAMLRLCTRYSSLVSDPAQLEPKLLSALTRALGTPRGPVHLSIPADILGSALSVAAVRVAHLAPRQALSDLAAIDDLCQALQAARSIAILIGSGAGAGADVIVALAERLSAPFLVTPDAKGRVHPHHPLFRGVFGFGGHSSADALLSACPELVLAFGTDLSEWCSGGWSDLLLHERLIHVDDDTDNFARSAMARMQLHLSPIVAAEQLLQRLPEWTPVTRTRPVLPASFTADTPRDTQTSDDNAAPVKPQRLMRELCRMPAETRFVADAGNSAAWAIHLLAPSFPATSCAIGSYAPSHAAPHHWLRVLANFAPMGWAIGAAIGIARANPAVPVVCITGDGSYLMSGQELTVAVAERLRVVFVVLNDSALGMVKHGQRLAGAEPVGFELPAVDYRMQALSVGAAGYRVTSTRELMALDLHALWKGPLPALIDVHIDSEEVPPMKLRSRVLGARP